MILRKPYAFLIKHFKLMHIILTVCMIYSIYRTELMIEFLNNYTQMNMAVMGRPIVSSLFNIWVFIVPAFVLLFSIILLVTMAFKRKPKILYILMIIVHIALFGVYIYGWTVFSNMQQTIVDMRTVNMLHDLLLYTILFQGIFSIASLIRGVGFDIKKFDFGRDIQDLNISSADNEEFEVAINFDLNDTKRRGKRALRYLKYQYLEHKFVFRMGAGLLTAFLLFYIYSHYNIYTKTNDEGVNFDMNGFTLGVAKSYLLNEDHKGNNISGDDAYLLVIDMNIKYNNPNPTPVATGAIELHIADDVYHHVAKYDGKLDDLGIVYNSQNISNEAFTHYLLVYEIPETEITSEMRIGFMNADNGKTAYVKLKPNDLTDDKLKVNEVQLGETISFEDTTLGNTTIKINDYDIKNRFTITYQYCSRRTNKCVNSLEYLTPNLYNSNYEKALLELTADVNFDENFYSNNIKNIYGLLRAFGKIEYEINGEKKFQTIYLGDVKSARATPGTYYIEVFQEIKAADTITLVFEIRNHVYRYVLR